MSRDYRCDRCQAIITSTVNQVEFVVVDLPPQIVVVDSEGVMHLCDSCCVAVRSFIRAGANVGEAS